MAQKGCRTAHRPPGGAAGLVSAGSPEAISIAVGPITFVLQGTTYVAEPATLTAVPVSAAPGALPPPPANLEGQERTLAAKVLKLLTALYPEKRLRKAPLIKVFNLYYQRGLQPAEIARICRCDRSLVFNRLTTIRANLPWTPQQLHELAPQVEALQDALTDSRAECIYRRGAIHGGDEGDDQGDE